MGTENNITKLGLNMNIDAWKNFRKDYTAALLFGFFNVVFNQFYVPIAIQHGATDFQVGLLTAAPAIGLLLSPLWASFIENNNPKPFVIYPNLIGRMLIVLPVIISEPWMYVFAALGFQMLMGIQAPAYASLISRIYPVDLRGRLMGNVRVVMGALMIPLAYFIGRWIDRSGDEGPLITAAVTGVISILVFARVKELGPLTKQTIQKRRSTLADQLNLVKGNKELLIFLGATTLSGFGNLLANPLYQIIQVDKLHLSNVELGYIRMMYFFCLLLSYLIMGWVIDKYSPKRAMYFGIAAFAAVPLLYGFFGTFPAIIIAGGIQGIGDATWEIGCLAYVFRIAPGREAVVFGIHLMLFGIRGTIGPLLSTSLTDMISMQAILYTAALCGWLGFLLLAYRSKKPSSYQSES